MTATQLSLDLISQARVISDLADTAPQAKQAVVRAGSRSLELLARRAAFAAKAKIQQAPVLDLDQGVTPQDFKAARVRRAVRKGRDVYLPSWSDYAVGLPNALLRSRLWAAGETDDRWMESESIATLGDNVSLLYSGKQMTQYDRKVFSACLEYYKEDRPLSGDSSGPWVSISFFQFAQGMNLAYTLNTHKALRASLIRLEAAALRVRLGTLEMPIPRLVEVAFDDGYQSKPDSELKGSDRIAFRVLEQLAQLYGPTSWTAVPKPALELKGLKSWLVGFYATHNYSRYIPFKKLQELSGMTSRPNDFRASVLRALDSLKQEGVDYDIRVAHYLVSADKKNLCVSLVRWDI